MADLGVWTVDGAAPQRVDRAHVDLERQLEDWIANDATLLADGLTVVGRQVWLDGGPLDLLAIDQRGHWVVIELKRERLYRRALAQALDYASSIAQMDGEGLQALLEPGLSAFGDAEELSREVRRQLDGEEGRREVAVLLAGVGVDAGLERIVAHLGGTYGVPITIVSFEVFELQGGGPRLLIREVTEEQTERQAKGPRPSVDTIRQRARDAGVEVEFDRFLEMSREAGLAVRPYKLAVMIAPPTARNRYLMLARPERGGIHMHAGPAQFAEFFPLLAEADVTSALGPYDPRAHFAGAELDTRLDQIEAFLKTLPSPDAESE